MEAMRNRDVVVRRDHPGDVGVAEASRVDQFAVHHHPVGEAGHVLPFGVLPELLVHGGRGGPDLLGPVEVREDGYRLGLQRCGEEQADPAGSASSVSVVCLVGIAGRFNRKSR